MAKFEKRCQAEKLRRKGLSIRQISQLLNVSKGSVSVWCRDIVLTNHQQTILDKRMVIGGHKGRILGAKANHDKKVQVVESYLKNGMEFVNELTRREKILIAAALYWGEGSKKDSRFSFSNSDPILVKIMAEWLVDEFNIPAERLAPRLFINVIHKPRLKKVLNFWSNLLELPVSQFGNPVLINSKIKKVYQNHDNYYGVIALKVSKSSNLKYEILGYIEAIKKDVGVAQLVVASDS